MDIATIERKRRQMNIPVTSLCAVAGVGRRHYEYSVRGERRPSRACIARLQIGLKRFNIGYGAEADQIAPHAALRATMVLAAFFLKADPRLALAADPGRRATGNPEWMEAARVRRVALYVANQFFGFTQSDLARAAGMTKQGVSNAIRELDDERDRDAALKALLDELEEVFS